LEIRDLRLKKKNGTKRRIEQHGLEILKTEDQAGGKVPILVSKSGERHSGKAQSRNEGKQSQAKPRGLSRLWSLT